MPNFPPQEDEASRLLRKLATRVADAKRERDHSRSAQRLRKHIHNCRRLQNAVEEKQRKGELSETQMASLTSLCDQLDDVCGDLFIDDL